MQRFPENEVDKWKALTNKHMRSFKIRQGDDGPADINPMTIKLDMSKKPLKVKVLRISERGTEARRCLLRQAGTVRTLEAEPK